MIHATLFGMHTKFQEDQEASLLSTAKQNVIKNLLSRQHLEYCQNKKKNYEKINFESLLSCIYAFYTPVNIFERGEEMSVIV